MGKSQGLRVKFFRGWDEPTGAKLADFELAGNGRTWRGRAWRLGETFEVDLNAALSSQEEIPPMETVPDVVESFRDTAICAGARQIRVRLPTTYLGSLDSAPNGSITARLVYVCVQRPSFPESIELLESRPIEELRSDRFLYLFNGLFVPDDLGLPLPADVDGVGRSMWEGKAVEGVSGDETRVLFHTNRPIGMFCFARDLRKRGAHLGFAGLLPSYRRTRAMAAAAKTVAHDLARLDAFPITMEIDTRNRRSLRMAERRCGPPTAMVAVFEI